MSIEAMKRIKSLLQDGDKIDSHTISAVVAECDAAILTQQPDNAACKSVQKRLEAQQPAAPEPVAWLYIEEGEVMFGHPNGYHPPDARPLVFGDTHPAPGVPGALKDHQIAALVNKVRDIARMFHGHQSLRERIAIELVPALKASQDVQSNAERWIYAIADGGNQSMNFIDIFDDWDGDGDFVEVFDAAMLADK